MKEFNWISYYLKRLKKAKSVDEINEIRDNILYYDKHDIDARTMFRLGELFEITKQIINEGVRK